MLAHSLPPTDPHNSVWKRGLGYRGIFYGETIRLHLDGVRRERGDLAGLLTVDHEERCLYRGKFNVASVTSRSSLGRYLRDRDGGYDGWTVVLEEFCREVLGIDAEGPATATLGQAARRPASTYQLVPLLPQGAATILFGPGGAFKSTVAAGIAVSVQSGKQLLPEWVPIQGNVMILDWESSEAEWNDRVVGIAEGMSISPPPVKYRRCSKRLTDLTESLADQVAREKIALLVIDSVGLAQGNSSDGGDANEATLRMFDALRAISTTTLLIDHVRGDEIGNAKASSKPYGSTYKVNLARSVFELRREEAPSYPEATQLLLRQSKVNDRAAQKPMGIRVIHGDNAILFERCDVSAPDLEQHSGTSADRMRRVLRSGGMAEEELAEELGITRAAVRQNLRRHDAFQRNPDGKIGLVVL